MTLLDLAGERRDALALDDLTRSRSYGELVDRATRLGRALRDEFGVGPGGHAMLLSPNRVEYLEVVTAALLSGSWLTPCNWHLTADELAFIIGDADPGVIFVDRSFEALARDALATRSTLYANARPGTADSRTTSGGVEVVVIDDDLDALIDGADDAPFDLDGPAGGNMFYTSGTTGRPKGVKRATAITLGAQLAAIPASGPPLGFRGSGPHLVTGPLYHAAPIGFAAMDLHQGAPLVIMAKWDERATLTLIQEREVHDTHLVPTMFVRLLRLPDDERAAFDPSSLRTVLHGAAPIAPSVKRSMIEWWGPVLTEYWGASEGGVVTLVGSEEWLEHPGTVGRAIPTHEVFAAADDGTPLPPGEVGVLWCRNLTTDKVFRYHNDDSKTAAAFRAPGTYTIGDIGSVDADGYVHLADRASNMIISGGVNIYPAEIEHVLHEHPAVADVAVFGIPDDEWGEQVKAAVELTDDVEPSDELAEELLLFARQRLAAFKVPKSIDFEATLPRTPAGKLYTRRLKDRYWSTTDRRI